MPEIYRRLTFKKQQPYSLKLGICWSKRSRSHRAKFQTFSEHNGVWQTLKSTKVHIFR